MDGLTFVKYINLPRQVKKNVPKINRFRAMENGNEIFAYARVGGVEFVFPIDSRIRNWDSATTGIFIVEQINKRYCTKQKR